jgi:hypothetical protein
MVDTLPDLKCGEPDSLGAKVLRILSKEPKKYIIYETIDHRIAVDGPDTSRCNLPGIHKAMMEIADISCLMHRN